LDPHKRFDICVQCGLIMEMTSVFSTLEPELLRATLLGIFLYIYECDPYI
jgi:hypothetical protein